VKKKMRWIAAGIFLLAAVSTALGVEYLNRVVLPIKARQWAEKQASESLGRQVTIGRLQIHLLHGFVAEQVKIAEDPRINPNGEFLSVDRLSGGILLIPLLKERELLIPALHLTNLRITARQNDTGVWNFSSIQPLKKEAGKKGFLNKFLIPRIELADATIIAYPAKSAPKIGRAELTISEANVTLSLPFKIDLRANSTLSAFGHESQEPLFPPVPFDLSGAYALETRDLRLQTKLKTAIAPLLRFLSDEWKNRLTSVEGELDAELELSGKMPGPYDWKLWIETSRLAWQTTMEFNGEAPLRGSGDLQLTVSANLPFKATADEWLNAIHGALRLDSISVEPLRWIGGFNQINGEVSFDNQGLRAEKISAQTHDKTAVEFSGSMLFDEARTFSVRAQTQIAGSSLTKFPLPFRTELAKASFGQPVGVEGIISGKLHPFPGYKTAVTLRLADLSVPISGQPQPLKIANGTLRWQPDLLTATGIQGTFQEKPFTANGTLVDFSEPEIDVQADWGAISATSQLTIHSTRIEIESLTGSFGGGNFRALGEIPLKTAEDPSANLLVEADFERADLEKLNPAWAAWMKSIKGRVNAHWLLEGNLADKKTLSWDLKLRSPSLVYQEIPMRQVGVSLKKDPGVAIEVAVKSTIAEGLWNIQGTLDNSRPELPWQGQLTIQGVELDELARLMKAEPNKFSGKLAIQWNGKGNGTALESYDGIGAVAVAGAKIFELPFLGKWADLLGVGALKAIHFREADGNFIVKDGFIVTDSLQLRSPEAQLKIVGKGGFLKGTDSPINWRLAPLLAADLLPEENRLKIGKAVAQGASYFLGEIQISGTWKEPKRKFVPKPITRILNEQIFNLQDLLGSLL
jgi:uncharacterized protein YhdP